MAQPPPLCIHRLANVVVSNTDAHAASAVTAYVGNDINAYLDIKTCLYTGPADVTVLYLAVLYTRIQTIAALGMRRDVQPRRGARHGRSPLFEACFTPATLHALLQAFPCGRLDVNKRCFAFDGTALHYAVRQGYFESVKLLLGAGADPHSTDSKHRTPEEIVRTAGYPAISELMRRHCVWASADRRAWMQACVAVAIGTAKGAICDDAPRRLLTHMLTDATHMSVPSLGPGPAPLTHRIAGELALVVALFL